MSLPESLYMFAYCVFIVGAGWAIWQPQQTLAVGMVAAALVLDFGTTLGPVLGVEALRFDVTGRNIAFSIGAPLGLLTWLLVIAALLAWWRGRVGVFSALLVAANLVWFLCFQSFQIGMHVLPQT